MAKLPEGFVLFEEQAQAVATPELPEGFVLFEESAAEVQQPLMQLQDLLARQAQNEQGLGPQIAELRKQTNQPDESETFRSKAGLGAELQNIASIGASAALEPVAGIAGGLAALNPFVDEGAGARTVKAVKDFAFQPRDEEAQQLQRAIGETVAPIAEPLEKGRQFLGDVTFDVTGSETAAALAQAVPEAILSILPANKAFRNVSKGLTKSGKTILTNTAKALPVKTKSAIARIMGDTAEAKRQFLVNEIKAGSANTDVVALMLNESGDLIPNKTAKNAIKVLGDDPEALKTIALANSMSQESKAGVNKMLDIVKKSRKDATFADANRIESVVGDAIGQRAIEIERINRTAGKNIGTVVESLKDTRVDISKASDTFFSKMDDLKVEFLPDEAGRLKPNFENSKFVGGGKDHIEKMANFFQDSKSMGFKDAHELKQFIREGVDFGKGTESALSGKSSRILKESSAEIAEILGNNSTAYKLSNAKFAKTIDLKKKLQKLAGEDFNLFDGEAGKALGLKARRILSNAQSGPIINKTLLDTDKVLGELGITFKNDVADLNSFAIRLLDNFKLEKQASLAGRIEATAGNVALGGNAGLLTSGMDLIKKIKEPDFNKKMAAFRAITKAQNKGTK